MIPANEWLDVVGNQRILVAQWSNMRPWTIAVPQHGDPQAER